MSHPLLERLTTELGYTEIDAANHEKFVSAPGMNVLFFPGDPATTRDATDVAVVLPELVAEFGGRLNPGVILDTFGDGKQLKQHYGFGPYPALVFVRGGEYVGAISRIQDWSDYLQRIGALLGAPPRRPPGFRIPVVPA